MKAAVIHAFGETPRFEEFPEPTLTEGDVLVHVRAAGIHPIVRALANGTHYGSTDILPLIPGIDGVGQLEDGTRVYFGMTRPPYGTLAERAVVPRQACLPLPASLDDVSAAALFNPGLSGWLALKWRAQIQPGETILILGATGSSGKLAIQIAKHLGAGKIIAVGRNQQILNTLPALGADTIIALGNSDEEYRDALMQAAGETGIHVILDYLYGHPTEQTIMALTRKGLTHAAPRVRLIEIGSMAGPTISLPAAVLRSSGLEISGSGGGTISPKRVFAEIPHFVEYATTGKLHIEAEQAPLSAIEEVWMRQNSNNARLVIKP
ncbi:NADPH:quinone reductase-like Zn-dependent oxidoreductase [Thermosporothrix hazakensis]|jgi:NADPH2:quinone reductase|uniref:NADPH:quinone reductase-like Zn-dependent oxidoreductase n=1 Tax=Thermosporothrix hazakensis TaxID=644383 RepID=A0A326UBW0_THEHA|nr:zinc-binding alcohol dehydrogenase family protein [Thermosporothrix hazakensis]PZW31172.1 NADPH:quinone reductase-like Zn-dependent oxidoreductase [Thermosporothrix hazakensis]GCE50917.1 alcohol dehydrogenase [Thermosporothrix hazakensis]